MKLSGRTMCPGAIAIAVLALLIAAPARCAAERLPITTYGPPHGLPGTFLEHVTRDSRGFVWIATRDGLSRFDGVRFVTYGVEHGLPNPTINFLLETHAGDYWVATNGGGLCRMDASAPMPAASTPSSTDAAGTRGVRGDRATLFTCYRVGGTDATNQINALHEDARGRVWIGSDGGLFRIDSPRGDVRVDAVPLEMPFGRVPGVHTIRQDARGVVWLGLSWGLVRIGPDDARTHYSIRALHATSDDHIWIGTAKRLDRVRSPALPRLFRRGRLERYVHHEPRHGCRGQSVGRDDGGRRDEGDAQWVPVVRHARRSRRCGRTRHLRRSRGHAACRQRRLAGEPVRRTALHVRTSAPAA